MGAMNATAHVLCAAAGGSVDEMWRLCEEMVERLRGRVSIGDGLTLHGFTAADLESGTPRYCFHPSGEQEIEFRSDDLDEALLKGAMYLARLLPDNEMWRRDG
jgi:predicted deacetylase